MSFRILGLDPAPFAPLYGLPDDELRRHRAIRYIVDKRPGFPERIELRDAAIGESLLLVNYVHQSADTPYHASHAVFVREGAREPYDRIDEVPAVMRRRTLSLRAFDATGMLVDADLAGGTAIEVCVERLLAMPRVSYLHAHYARHGCYAARIGRPGTPAPLC